MINLTKINCRACLKIPQKNEKWNSIHPKLCTTLAEKFVLFTGFEINEFNDCAMFICKSCEKILIHSLEFLKLCQKSHNILKDHFENIKLEEDQYVDLEILDSELIFVEENLEYNLEIKLESTAQNNSENPKHALTEIKEQDVNYRTQTINSSKSKKSRASKKNPVKEAGVVSIQNNEYLSKGSYKQSKYCVCEICGKIKHRASIEFHRNLHTGIHAVKCEICGRKFAHKSYLRGHMITHQNEKKFECSFCNKKFLRRYSRKLHEKTHTKDYSHECKVCGKKFLMKSKLNLHMRIHNDERPYRCEICDVRFRRDHHLINHIKTKAHKELEQMNGLICTKLS